MIILAAVCLWCVLALCVAIGWAARAAIHPACTCSRRFDWDPED